MPLVVVFGAPLQSLRTHRTLRAASKLGLPCVAVRNAAELMAVLDMAGDAAWLLRAGAFPIAYRAPPPKSRTQKPLLALGATRRFGDERLMEGLEALLHKTGGDLRRWPEAIHVSADSVWIDEPQRLGALLRDGRRLEDGLRTLSLSRQFRAIRAHELDVRRGDKLRVMLAITTLHRGGAERLVLHLRKGLESQDIDTLLCVLDKAARDTFDAPEGTVFLSDHGDSRAERFMSLVLLAQDFGADIIHTHLLDGDELRELSQRTSAVLVNTLHNEEAGWPEGTKMLSPKQCALTLSCSLKVERDARACLPAGMPVRTLWNAIDPPENQAPSPTREELRASLGIPSDAPLLLSVANYRPQKRLEELPSLLAELRGRGVLAHALLIGEKEKGMHAAAISTALNEQALALGVRGQLLELGSETNLSPYYAAGDMLISLSAHEGLSMAWLEALSAGLPLTVRDVGGALELSQTHPGRIRVLPQDASIAGFAEALREHLLHPPNVDSNPKTNVSADFSVAKMGERHALLYRRAVRTAASVASPHPSLVLVTNNLSTGGAQSSARRLLMGLASSGIRVRAAVLQEQAEYPTPGRAELLRQGISVYAAPRAEDHDPLFTAQAVASFIDEAPTDALLFWNVIPEHKLLLADMMLGQRVFDVSPGEMYFASLARYFTKPRPALPYLDARGYGRLLSGVVVKYEAEAQRAGDILGAPVSVIPNGVIIPPTCPHPRPVGERVIFGTLARISPDKKLEELLDAARLAHPRMPAWELRIAGAPELGCEEYASALRERASGLPVKWVGEAQSAAFLRELDAFVMISEPAGCPNASLEAMAQGLCVAATDHGGVREQVVNGETGYLVGRGNMKGLAEALVSLAHDRELRGRLGQAAYARAQARFGLPQMVERYAALLFSGRTG